MTDKVKTKFPYNKDKFVGFVEKYFLNGLIDAAIIKIKDNEVNTIFKNSGGDIRGWIKMSNWDFEDCEIGCYDTSRLISMISVLDRDIKMEVEYNNDGDQAISLRFKDARGKKVNFATSDLDTIDADGKKITVKEYDLTVNLNQEIISDILKSNGALNNNQTITFLEKNDKLFIVFGYSQTNSNTIEFEIEPDVMEPGFEITSFQSRQLKEILAVNNTRFDEALLQINSSKGVMRLVFTSDELTSEYWLVKLQD